MVDGLFDSIDIEPRVRFGVLFGVSSAAILAAIFFSKSFWDALFPDFDIGVPIVFVLPPPNVPDDKLLLVLLLLFVGFANAEDVETPPVAPATTAVAGVTAVREAVLVELFDEAPDDSKCVCWWPAFDFEDDDDNDSWDDDFDCELCIDWYNADEDDGFALIPLDIVLIELVWGCGVDVRAKIIHIFFIA